MENLSAKSLDSRRRSGSSNETSREQVEHLRDLRDVYTPFIEKYIEQFQIEESKLLKQPQLLEKGFYLAAKESPNYEKLLTTLALDGYSGKNKDYAWLELLQLPLEEAYQRTLRRENIQDRPEGREEFAKEVQKMRQVVEECGFPVEYLETLGGAGSDKSPATKAVFRELLRYTLRNASAFTDEGLKHEENAHHIWFTGFPLKKAAIILWGRPASQSKHDFPPVLVMPVGEYGGPTTRKIFNAAQIMLERTRPLEEESARIVDRRRELFAKTARGDVTVNSLEHGLQTAVVALREGITTLGQSVAQLTAERLSGCDDGDAAVEAVIRAELPKQLAYRIPPGTIGPLSLIGKYLGGMVQQDENGRLILNPAMVAAMSDFKDKLVRRQIVMAHPDTLPAAGRGCPVAFTGKNIELSGINRLSPLFLTIYKSL